MKKFTLKIISSLLAVAVLSATPLLAGKVKNENTGIVYKGETALFDAIVAASDNDTLKLKGDFTEQVYTIGISLTLVGSDDATVDGDQLDSVFTLISTNQTVTFRNLTIRNGGNTTNGGGVANYNSSNTLIFEDVRIVDNNASTFGGGIYTEGPLTIEDSLIKNNFAGEQGGGIYSNNNTVVINNSEIEKNTTPGNGGGLFLYISTSATITDTEFHKNYAGINGGGLYSFDSLLDIYSSDFNENSADDFGGGLYLSQGEGPISFVTLTDTDVEKNSAGESGGGIFLEFFLNYIQKHCEVKHNTPNDIVINGIIIV
jgi:predicted outer membrane repeat protein